MPSSVRALVEQAVKDGVKRLLKPSIDREVWSVLMERATQEATEVFSIHVSKLLLTPPLVGCRVLGLDPGFSHGVKIATVDESGEVLSTAVIYPFDNRSEEAARHAKATLHSMLQQHTIKVLAIGDGVGSVQTEKFVSAVLRDSTKDAGIGWTLVSERGASVYSASELAGKELPSIDVSLRGAVSIARRLQVWSMID